MQLWRRGGALGLKIPPLPIFDPKVDLLLYDEHFALTTVAIHYLDSILLTLSAAFWILFTAMMIQMQHPRKDE